MTTPARSRSTATQGWRLGCALLAAAATLAAGCVQRRLTVRTNPPGARVYVDNHEIGTTPVSASFIYYGKRDIRIVKDGYETQTFLQPVPAPWWQCPPLDFITENVIPWEIRDHRVVDRQLAPQMVVPTEELLARAQQLRGSSQVAASTAPSNLAPPGVNAPPLGAPGVPTMPAEPVPPVVQPLPPGVPGGQLPSPLPPQQLLPAQP